MKTHERFPLSLALFFLLAASAKPLPAGDDHDDAKRVEAVRQMYAKLPPDILDLQEPITIVHPGMLFDAKNGTLFVKLKDARQQTLEACLEKGDYLRSHVYIGGIEPSAKGARKVAVRGPEESALYGLLIRWAERHPLPTKPMPELSPYDLYRLSMTHYLLAQLDKRFCGKPAE